MFWRFGLSLCIIVRMGASRRCAGMPLGPPMNDEQIEALRVKAARAGQPVECVNGRFGFSPTDPPDAPPYESLADALAPNDYVAYPSGLVQPYVRTNWFWGFADGVRLGSAMQAASFARRNDIDPSTIVCIAPEDVHGTCVLVGGGTRNWRLIQARTFPTWAGV